MMDFGVSNVIRSGKSVRYVVTDASRHFVACVGVVDGVRTAYDANDLPIPEGSGRYAPAMEAVRAYEAWAATK
jgi:hypothetical protein